MIFNSIPFLIGFLPLSLLVYYLTPMKGRNVTLLLLSLFFFSWGSPQYLGLMAASVLVNYAGVRWMDGLAQKTPRKRLLVALVTFNLLILFVFKYLGFFFWNLNGLLGTQITVRQLVWPLGISFYTFQVLSYVLDVYKGQFPASKNLLQVALYFLMFPQLASGPIMRWDELSPQFAPRLIRPNLMADGAERFVVGLFKKVLVANSFWTLWQTVKGYDPSKMSALLAWVGILGFTFYIYFDFSGYMDMAIGTANLFGFQLQENFDFPYTSKSIGEFWRRWHMTLGRFFRDYLYIPMGGSREGTGRYLLALFTVWFTTGLWHGAAWHYILWGLWFGVLILVEHWGLKRVLGRIPSFFAHLYTMILVIIGWVFFALPNLSTAGAYLRAMAGGGGLWDRTGFYYLYTYALLFLLAVALSTRAPQRVLRRMKYHMNPPRRVVFLLGLVLMLILSTAFILNQSYSPSMYIGF
ncbi:putative poly(beta-D-mannuronate) O-acetylase [Clostridiaceae bacterium JG1575]|nr:putative poly(beta-D-mannuronate) O-acetylase [Clostridiaceae bacterium JG1575]